MFQTLFTDSPDFSYFLFTTIPGQVIQVIPFVLLVGLIDSLIRFLRIKRGNITSYRIGNEVVKTLLVCYFAGLFALVWVPPRFWSYLWHMAILGWYDPGAGSGPLFTWSFHFVPSLYQWIAGDLTLGSWVRTMLGGNVLEGLFAEELGALIQVPADRLDEVMAEVKAEGLEAVFKTVGELNDEDALVVLEHGKEILREARTDLTRAWCEVSNAIARNRDNPVCADSETDWMCDKDVKGLPAFAMEKGKLSTVWNAAGVMLGKLADGRNKTEVSVLAQDAQSAMIAEWNKG